MSDHRAMRRASINAREQDAQKRIFKEIHTIQEVADYLQKSIVELGRIVSDSGQPSSSSGTLQRDEAGPTSPDILKIRGIFAFGSDRAAAILQALMTNGDGGLSYSEALSIIYGDDLLAQSDDVSQRALIRVYICDIRSGLSRYGMTGMISNQRRWGYQLPALAAARVSRFLASRK